MLNTQELEAADGRDIAASQEAVEKQLVNWIRGVVRSNYRLELALERLRRSYALILTGHGVTDSEEVLKQVDDALRDAHRANTAA